MRTWLTAIFAVALTACGSSNKPATRQPLADAEASIFSAAMLDSERETYRSDAALGRPLAAWGFRGLEARASELGWVVGVAANSDDAAVVALDVDFDAESVDVLELQVDAAPPLGRVSLRWFKAGEAEAQRSVLEADLGLLNDTLRFRSEGVAGWSGRIRRLEWQWSRIPDGQRLLIRGFRGLESEPDGQRLAQALEKSWRIDVKRVVRPSLVALPGVARQISVWVPKNGVFRCFLGATAARPKTTWVLRARGAGVSRPFELLRETLTAEDVYGWHGRRVDLSAYGGREVHLELEVIADAPWKPGEGLPVWGSPEITAPTEDSRPDLILVSADTLRADHLSLYGYERPTSPHLEGWAAEHGVVFTRAIAPSPWTLPSHTSLFTGLDVLEHGVSYGRPAPAALSLLAERLRDAGYVTYADTGGGYLHPAYGLGQGFDVFRYPASQVPEAGDLAAAIGRAKVFAESRSEPVFLFLHSYETHEPYSPRQPHFEQLAGEAPANTPFVTQWVEPRPEEGFVHRRRFVTRQGEAIGEDHASVIDLYDSRVANLDAQLQELLVWHEQRATETALLVTSDHGESLGEEGRGGHAALEEQLLHIPMILALPGARKAGSVVNARVRLIDVAPTFLELAGLKSDGQDGRSLLEVLDGTAEAREAWSASPSTNAGVTLESEAGWRFRRQASAWAANGRQAQRILGDIEQPSPEEVAAHQRRIVKRLEETSRGLEILFVNHGSESFQLILNGSVVQNHRVKSWDAPPEQVRWLGQVEGVELTVEPGDRWRLMIFAPGGGDVEARSTTGESWHLDFEAESLPLTLELEADGESWRRRSGDSPPITGVRFRWRGVQPGDQDTESADVGEELQRQLEALGYVG